MLYEIGGLNGIKSVVYPRSWSVGSRVREHGRWGEWEMGSVGAWEYGSVGDEEKKRS